MNRVLLFTLLLVTVCSTQAAHITDQLLAGLYTKPSTKGEPSKVLPSGTPLEVLEEQQAFTRIRLGDSTEGWVENSYITNDKPAKVQLLELQAKNTLQAQKLSRTEAELGRLQRSKQAAVTADNQALDAAKAEIAELKTKLSEANTTPMWRRVLLTLAGFSFELWHLGLLCLIAISGFIAGMIFKGHRIAKRLGGLRV